MGAAGRGGGAGDHVAGQGCDLGLEAGGDPLGAVEGALGVRHPGGGDQLAGAAEHVLGLAGGHAGQLDHDPVAAQRRHQRLVDAQAVDAAVDDRDLFGLHVGGRAARGQVFEAQLHVGAALDVEALVDVELPVAEVRRQVRRVSGE